MKTRLQILAVSLLSVVLFACSDSDECTLKDFATGNDRCGPDYQQPPPPPPAKNSSPQVGVDGSGNALFVWENYSGSNYNIATRLYTPSNGWGTKEIIGSNSCGEPKMEMESGGTAIVVWSQRTQLLLNQYTPNSGWSSSTVIDPRGCNRQFGIAMNDNGDAVAIWKNRFGLNAAHYVPNVGWSAAQTIESNDRETYGYMTYQVAMNNNHEIVVVWAEKDVTFVGGDVWVKQYSPDSGWEDSEFIERNNLGNPIPKVAIDSTGNVVVAWGDEYSIMAKHYDTATGWGANKVIWSHSGFITRYPQLAMNSDGKAIVLWKEHSKIWSSHYESGIDWSVAQTIENNDSYENGLKIAMDNSGNAIAVWLVYKSQVLGDQVLANYYSVSSGWGNPQQLNSNVQSVLSHPQLAMDNNGHAVAIWEYSLPGSASIREYMASHFTPGIGWESSTVAVD